MPEAEPRFSPTQEVRFALVMYGGSSLCIYMNGVAQEFLNLVRSTAPSAPLSENPSSVKPAKSTEKVYRKIGQLLCYGQEPRLDAPAGADVTTRFVVDIISGSSAGGINGVFLARALANDKPLDQLKRLWVDEGDFARLLNDKGSTGDKPRIPLRDPPESLMNSHRMYYKLLEAFRGMGERDADFQSPLVEELDLAVTTTDLKGLTMPIKLYDSVVLEPRYRNVFLLKYRTEMAAGRKQNDFASFNAGLAFVSRCTSAFPFVFEPMTLHDINAVAGENKTAKVPFTGPDVPWDTVYFPEYARAGDSYRLRPFSDGGDIDNKPFSYAIDNLTVRRSTVPVVRKLIYVEPDPGQYELGVDASGWINPIQSVLLAGTLPRKETIREDLDRVRAHNMAAKRVAEAIETVQIALEAEPKAKRDTTITGEPATARTDEATAQWVKARGAAVRALGLSDRLYHRTKVQQTVSQLGRLLAEAAGYDEESDRGLAVRILVQSWVAARYADPFADPMAGDPPDTERQFLLDFDVEYRMRRINFVERRADELLCHGNPRSRRLLALALESPEPPGDQEAFDAALKEAKRQLNAAYVGLRRFRWELAHGLAERIATLDIEPAQLDAILVTQPVQQLLHEVSVDGPGGMPVTFGGDPMTCPNPLTRGALTFTVLGSRDDEAIRHDLSRRDDDPATARTVLWPTRAAGEPAKMGLDASSVLVVDLARPAEQVTFRVSALAWPPTLLAYGADGEPLAAVETSPSDQADLITVRADGIRRVVMRSRSGAVATKATPLERAGELLKDSELGRRIKELADALRGRFEDALRAASARVDVALRHDDSADPSNSARKALRFFFDQFDGYDLATLPLLLAHGGEAAPVDVLRVSPYDATSLVPASKAAGKLAGNQLGHYGAFLSAGWRRSDIMWGRLDAAERLITALLPVGHPQREALVKEAQEVILGEELAGDDVTKALQEALLGGDIAAVPEAVEQVRAAVARTVSGEGLRDAVAREFELPPGPDTRYRLDVASRATRIIGDILKGMTDPTPRRPGEAGSRAPAAASGLKWPGRILSRLGQVVWGLVEISVPGTITWRLARYYLQLLIFIEVFVIGAGILFGERDAVRLGWLSLAITLVVVLAKAVMKEILRDRGLFLWALAALVGLLALVLLVFGGVRAAHNAEAAACRSKLWLVERAHPFDCPDVRPAGSAPR